MLLVYSPKYLKEIGVSPTCEQLSQLPLIAYDEDLPLVRTLWATMFDSPLLSQAAFTIPDFRIILNMVLSGQGWTVLPDFIAASSIESGLLVSPTNAADAPRNEFYLVWNKRALKSPNLIHARDHIARILGTQQPGNLQR